MIDWFINSNNRFKNIKLKENALPKKSEKFYPVSKNVFINSEIIENKNYGWPEVSYGTQYNYDENGKAYEISHENNNFEEPLFALVPSVGISSVNNCPSILKNYYKKPCLLHYLFMEIV